MIRTVAMLFLTAAAVSAQDTVDFRFRMKETFSLKVEQTLEIRCMDKEQLGLKVIEAPLVRGSWQFKEEWTDTCISEVDGKPVKVKRTWAVSKTSASTKGKAPTIMEGAVVVFEAGGTAAAMTAAVEKGKPGKQTIDVLCKGPVDTVGLFLPTGPLAVGGTFKVTAATVDRFLRLAFSTAPSADRGCLLELAKVIESLSAETESLRAVELSAKLVSIEKDEAVIEYAGKLPKGLGTTEIKATLRWEIAAGRPRSLQWNEKRVVLQNEDARSDGYTEEITLNRTWK